MADKAVLCGINEYRSISDLRGCINDVDNLARLLIESLEFPADNVRTLKDDEVTIDRVNDAFEWLADGSSDGDRLVFHFSGHGSFTPSDDNDEALDELLCLYDMDWDDPETYLIDDDLAQLTRRVARGRLTVVLDCCHSGTGTRALTSRGTRASRSTSKSQLMIDTDTAVRFAVLNRELSADESADGDNVARLCREEKVPPVVARFVSPPSRLGTRSSARRICKLGKRAAEGMNHQLLAGARDDQTAADAFIGGDFHGAFSFYLCDSVRKHLDESYDKVMAETVKVVQVAGFSQVPQNEGPFGAERVFGADDPVAPIDTDDDDDDDFDVAVAGPKERPLDELALESAASSHPMDMLASLLRVSEKLIDAAQGTAATAGPEAARRDAADEVAVYVHGISRHTAGYSVPWFNALRPHLARDVRREEVLWSSLVNPRSTSSAEASQMRQFVAEFDRVIDGRTRQLERHLAVGETASRLERPRGSGFSVDDFARYMFQAETRAAILQRFHDIVDPLLAAGHRLHIFGHSWGTVVAYEGLRELDSRNLPGRVLNFFTIGSALSISAVRANLFGRVGDGRRPRAVRRIINLDAGGDIVGGPIGDHFPVHREFLGLKPVGCREIPFTDIAFNPGCAHSSYFRPANREVNRGIFGRFVNDS